MTIIRLWYSPGACSLGTHIALQETALEFELINANNKQSNGAFSLADDFQKINPKKMVPVLGLDSDLITEGPAILLAISTLAPHLQLYETTSIEQIRVAEWLNWLSGTLHGQGFGPLFRPQRYADDPDVYERLGKKALLTIQNCFQWIEEQVDGEHAVGSLFTVVDAYLVPFWRWGNEVRFNMNKAYPKYTALVTKVFSRECGPKSIGSRRLTLALDSKLHEKSLIHTQEKTIFSCELV